MAKRTKDKNTKQNARKNYQFVQINHINQLNFREQIKTVKHRQIQIEQFQMKN